MKRIGLCVLLVAVFLGLCGYWYYDKIGKKSSLTGQGADIVKARALLKESKPHEAIDVIAPYFTIEGQKLLDPEVIDIAISANEAVGDSYELSGLYRLFPDAFGKHEEGSLLVARGLIAAKDYPGYEQLRGKWRKVTKKPNAWVLLDAESLMSQGKSPEAERLLQSQSFEGEDETNRLVRLAIIKAPQDLEAAWKILAEAGDVDPNNPHVHTRRAQIAEISRNIPVALTEYWLAFELDPKNIQLRNQLGEFFLRYQQYSQALQVWMGGLADPGSDILWLKVLFWSRVAQPVNIEGAKATLPRGRFASIDKYLLELPTGVFWDEKAYAHVERGSVYLQKLQETFWLRLIDHLKKGEEEAARQLLDINPFRNVMWNYELEVQLKRVLAYRKKGTFEYDVTPTLNEKDTQETSYKVHFSPSPLRHTFFEQINAIASETRPGGRPNVPADLQALLKGPDAFSAIFLAVGWLEAGLQLQTLKVIPSDYPEWLAYGVTQALRQTKNDEAALAFATAQKRSTPMVMLLGELLLSTGNSDAGVDELLKIHNEHTDHGMRAVYLLTTTYIAKGDLAKAKEEIKGHPAFASSQLGQESLAHIALLEKNEPEADRIYQGLEKESLEAKSYLAKRAYEQGDWLRARKLTEQLLLIFPTNQMLRQNLANIMEAQRQDQAKKNSEGK